MLHVYPTPIRVMISGRDIEKLLKNEKAVLDLRRDQVPPFQLLAQYRSIPDFSSAHCTPGSTKDGQNCTYDDQDDADGGQNTQPREEADQRQNNAENNHVRTSSGMRIKMIYSTDATTKTSHSINPIIDVVNTELVLLPNSLDVKTSAFSSAHPLPFRRAVLGENSKIRSRVRRPGSLHSSAGNSALGCRTGSRFSCPRE